MRILYIGARVALALWRITGVVWFHTRGQALAERGLARARRLRA